ncbi:hypothetical protein D3C80_1032200 [compost metagenome]
MERRRITPGERANQRTNTVWVAHGKGAVLQQVTDVAQHIGRRAGGLQNKPLIHHQTVLMPFVIILLHQRVAAWQLGGNGGTQRGQRIGHVIGVVILLAD